MRKSKSQAMAEAKELCKLLGDGWEPEIWENLGWCYAARKGGVEVRYSDVEGVYCAGFKPHPIAVGDSDISPALALDNLAERFTAIAVTGLNDMAAILKVRGDDGAAFIASLALILEKSYVKANHD